MSAVHAVVKHPLTRFVGPLAGLVCVVMFLAGLDLPEVGIAFERVSWWWLAPMLLLGCINLWLRAIRWGVLLAPTAPLPTAQLLGIGLTAGLAGLGLPARGGDAVKVVLATRLPGVRLSDVAAAEILERVVDGFIFGTFIAVAAVLAGVGGWPLTLGLGVLALYLPVLTALPVAAWYFGAPGELVQDGLRPRWHPRRILHSAKRATQRRSPSLLARAFRISLLAWATEAASYYCLLVAFGWIASPSVPFATVGVANFAFAIPGAPAGVGTFHLPVSSLLVDSFGAEPALAAAFAVALHIAVLVPVPFLWAVMAARDRWEAMPVRIR
jgi:uncharacterized membrane protein YbhN (UPF0104 family)